MFEKKEIHFMFSKISEEGFYYHSYRSYPNVEKLWLCDMLRIKSGDYGFGKIGNVFLNKIYRNTLKNLIIFSGFTLFKELEILSKSPFLTEIILHTAVKNENDEPSPIEEIMVLLPNLKVFGISPSNFTMESFNKLLEFKFSNKFEKLYFEL
uniref:Uncharacterized protein n=1 Tax=Panagrolaimus sp. PS1159 TaxID=55785 RepID=A0AC35G1N3_9BILA